MKILINGFVTKRIERANRWSDECSLEILPAYLRGKAADIYENLTVREISTLNEVSQALSNRFNPREIQRLYQSELFARQQSPTESLSEYAESIQDLVKRAFCDIAYSEFDTQQSQEFLLAQPFKKRLSQIQLNVICLCAPSL